MVALVMGLVPGAGAPASAPGRRRTCRPGAVSSPFVVLAPAANGEVIRPLPCRELVLAGVGGVPPTPATFCGAARDEGEVPPRAPHHRCSRGPRPRYDEPRQQGS